MSSVGHFDPFNYKGVDLGRAVSQMGRIKVKRVEIMSSKVFLMKPPKMS